MSALAAPAAAAAAICRALACGQPGCRCAAAARHGTGLTHCPTHGDEHPSLKIDEAGGKVLVRCFGGCPQDMVIAALRECGLWPERQHGRNGRAVGGNVSRSVKRVTALHSPGQVADPGADPGGLTLEQLAEAKRLTVTLLREWGVTAGTYAGQRAVRIPYYGADGELVAVHWRLSLHGTRRFAWRRGDHPSLYGLEKLPCIRELGWVLLVEGESDVWTCWTYEIPSLGVPGKSTWRREWAAHLAGLEVLVWQEPGAEDFARRITTDLPAARVIVAPEGIKDPSEAHTQGHDVAALIAALRQHARPLADLLRIERDAELAVLASSARPVLEADDPLELVAEAIRSLGYAGQLRPAVITYLAITSRLLRQRPGSMPVHLLLVGPPSAGKSYTLGTVLRLLPGAAYHAIDASSPRVLLYDDADLRHRALIFSEADSLPAGEDNPAASAVRTLLQEHRLAYKVVVRDPETGDYTVREVAKAGPSVLITTATRRLGEQLDSRLFSLDLPDDQEQVRAALAEQARLEAQGAANPDEAEALVAYQAYLQQRAPWDVAVPFAGKLAEAIGRSPVAPRILRDFARLLSLIKSVALLRHRQRQRDADGRIMAMVDDYRAVYKLVADMYEASATGAGTVIRETVDAVRVLTADGGTTTVTAVAEHLHISKMSASRRVKTALRAGWLRNTETRKGVPAALQLGEPLPPTASLPLPEDLSECNAVTPRTVSEPPSHPAPREVLEL